MGGSSKARRNNGRRGRRAEAREADECGTSGSDHHYRARANGEYLHGGGVLSNGGSRPKAAAAAIKSVVPASSPQDVTVSELDVNSRHEGRVLSGTFCVEPFVISAVHTVLEDKFGATVRILIDDDAAVGAAHKPRALARYAKGRYVRISDPYLKVWADGGTVVSVDDCRHLTSDDPCDEDEDEDEAKDVEDKEPNGDDDPEIPLSPLAEADGVRLKGNRLFADQDWKAALVCYTECISKCLLLHESSPEGGEGEREEELSPLKKTLLLAYSNRSETWLRHCSYDEAQADAARALEIDAKHVKSLVRSGKALFDLQRYEDSAACFGAALRESPDDPTIKAALARSRASGEQARTGAYDLTDFYMSCCSRQPPACSDFVGPVEIRQPAGEMRGLFATRDVAAGDLLLVSNAVAVCHSDKYLSESDEEGGCGACEACEKQKSWTHREFARKNSLFVDDLVAKLTAHVRSSRRRMLQVDVLAGPNSSGKKLPIPSMDLFDPASKWAAPSPAGGASSPPELDVEALYDIVRNNAIDEILNDPRYFMCAESDQLVSALWVLPAIMNHSCCANSESWLVGEAMFVRACRPIRAGEELTRSYFDTLKGLERRQEFAGRWPFKCTCQRCQWESSIPEPHNRTRKKLCKRVQKFFFETYATPAAPNLERLANLVNSVEETIESVGLEGKFRLWIRASLMDAYIANIHVLLGMPTRRIDAIRTVLDAMIEVGGGLALRPQIASTLLREVRRKYGKGSPMFRSTEAYVMGVYRPFYGDLNKKAFWSLAKMHAGGDGMD